MLHMNVRLKLQDIAFKDIEFCGEYRSGKNGRMSVIFKTTFKTVDSWRRLNKKNGLTRYGDSHVKDKTS